jgi:hypothetical protein
MIFYTLTISLPFAKRVDTGALSIKSPANRNFDLMPRAVMGKLFCERAKKQKKKH